MYKTSDGKVLQHTATAAITDGSLLKIGDSLGVAMNSGVTGDLISVALEGKFNGLSKKAAANTDWAIGGRVYYITTGGVNKLTGIAAAGTLVGIGGEAAATGAATGCVILGVGVNAPTVDETAT